MVPAGASPVGPNNRSVQAERFFQPVGPNNHSVQAERFIERFSWTCILGVLRGHCIAFARALSAAPPHDFVEGIEIGARLSILEEALRRESGNLFRNRYGHELIDARAFLFAEPLDRLF
jgi:hypothetical protein